MKKMNFLVFVMFYLTSVFSVIGQQWGLYTFYSPANSVFAYLVDTNGTTYKTWTFNSSYRTGYSSYLLRGDTILRSVAHLGNLLNGGGMTGEVQKVTWNGTIVWDYVYSSSTYCLHHDICPMPNGNVLLISYEVKTATEATQAGSSKSIVIWADKIIEVHPTGASTGTIVWEWHVWDHLCQNYNISKDNYVTSIVQNPQLLNINYLTAKDWLHMNGVDYNADLDQIVISSHYLNEIYVIDHSTTTSQAASHSGGNSGKGGDILYRWGNPTAYGATGTTDFNVVHDAHWVHKDCPMANYLVGFNNKGGTGSKSCIDIISPPYNGYNYSITLGSAYLPSTYTSRYTTNFSAQDLGNSQQLPNGNMLICNPAGTIYEINPGGTSIWSKTAGGSIAQAFRYTNCYVRGPVAICNPSVTSVCTGASVTLNSSATSVTESNPVYTYSWSSYPAGFSSTTQNPLVSPDTITAYKVIITNTSIGCSDSATVTVTVNHLPSKPTITQVGSLINSTTAPYYQWFYHGGIINGANSQAYNPSKNGYYKVQITDSNGCTAMSDSINFLSTGLNRVDDNSLEVYPNPTTGNIDIKVYNQENTNYKIKVYNIFGEVLLEGSNITAIDLSNNENGIYLIFLKFENTDVIKKRIVLMK